MNREKKIKMLVAKCKAACVPNQTQAILANWVVETSNSFGCQQAITVPCTAKQEKGTTMDTRTEAQQAKDYLINSLRDERRNKIDSEFQAFNLNGQHPTTVKELKDGLAKGFLTIPDRVERDLEDDDRVYSIWDLLVWRDPSKKPDPKGYEAAKKLIEKDVAEVQDTIIVFGAEKGLEKLNEFKAKIYH